MTRTRVFSSSLFVQDSDDEPIRSVVKETKDAVIVVWYIKSGQQIKPHVHPKGQDTWTILSGSGEYYLDAEGSSKEVKAGDIVIAYTNDVHGLFNNSDEPVIFVSVVSPADAGFELLS